MPYRRTISPSVEPVSVNEAKAHLRIDGDDENAYVQALIVAAREYAEPLQGRAYITQTWEMVLDKKPGREIFLPRPPLQSVSSIVFTDKDGVATTVSAADYIVDSVSQPGRVVLKDDKDWPAVELPAIGGVKITFVAGYGANGALVPETIKQAILLMIGHWYSNREEVVLGGYNTPAKIPFAAHSLLQMERVTIL